MRSFLLWKNTERSPSAERVSARMGEIFAPLFEEPPTIRQLGTPHATVLYLELPVRGFRPPCFQEDEETWALAIDYPLDAPLALEKLGSRPRDERLLLELARKLQVRPEPLLRELSPPFSLIWGDKREDVIYVQNDGLGMAQLFVHDGGDLWAVTNRALALRALDVELEPVPREWATRFTLGWFPRDTTGFRGARFLPPATRCRIDGSGVHESRHDVLTAWVHPRPRSREECLELGRESLVSRLHELSRVTEEPGVGLSGGWDSRALVSILRHLQVPFSARVRGSPDRLDVRISSELARIAGFHVRLKTGSGLPPDTADECRRSIELALRWQTGGIHTPKHKSFLSRKHHLLPGTVSVMGQHGGLGKGDFVKRIRAWEIDPERYEEVLVDELMQKAPRYLRVDLRDAVRDELVAAYRQADAYDLRGMDRLNFFYLTEFTRRWASASLASQTSLVCAPFLNPDFVRACYALPAEELRHNPIHRYVTERYAPDWKDVPYEDRITEEEAAKLPEIRVKHRKRKVFSGPERWKRPRPHKKYFYTLYWKEAGLPLLEEALVADGFWTTLFEPKQVRLRWKGHADEIVIAHLLPEILSV